MVLWPHAPSPSLHEHCLQTGVHEDKVQMAEVLSKHAREGALKVDGGLLCLHRGPGSHLQGCC